MRPALPEPAASLRERGADRGAAGRRCASTPFPEVPGDAARAAPPRHPARRRSPTGTSRCTSASPRPGWRRCSTARSRRPSSASPSPDAGDLRPRAGARGRRGGGGLARRRLARGRRRGRPRAGLTPVLVARDEDPVRPAPPGVAPDRRARRPTLIAGWLASRPPPAPSRSCDPSCRTGCLPSACRPCRSRRRRPRTAARVAALGAVRGHAGHARDRDPGRDPGHGGRAARRLRGERGRPAAGRDDHRDVLPGRCADPLRLAARAADRRPPDAGAVRPAHGGAAARARLADRHVGGVHRLLGHLGGGVVDRAERRPAAGAGRRRLLDRAVLRRRARLRRGADRGGAVLPRLLLRGAAPLGRLDPRGASPPA